MIQRSDSADRLNVHFHVLCSDGAFCKAANGQQFITAPPLRQAVVEQVLADILKRIERQCTRLLGDPEEDPADTLSHRDPAMAAVYSNALLGRQSDGKDAGKAQRVEFAKGTPKIVRHGQNCARS